MKIGIIGAGNIGRAYAVLWHAAGHQVFLSSRTPENHREFVESLGDGALVGSSAEAAAFGDVILLAPNYASSDAAIEEIRPHVQGKLVMDAMNPLRKPGDRRTEPLIGDGEIAGLVTAAKLPEARIAKAFTTLWSRHVETKSNINNPTVALPFAVDDAEDQETLARLITDAGFVPAYVGSLKDSGPLDPGSPIWNIVLTKDEALAKARDFNFSRTQ
ncbi:MAG: NAD(P)-binding domain-containing protein [Acidobacteriota bacterium]